MYKHLSLIDNIINIQNNNPHSTPYQHFNNTSNSNSHKSFIPKNFDFINSNKPYINQYSQESNTNVKPKGINDYTEDNPHYDKEEPTFQNENDKNIKQYLNYIQTKQKITERNSKHYLNYLIKERKEKRTNLSFTHKTVPSNNEIYLHNNTTNNNSENNFKYNYISSYQKPLNRYNEQFHNNINTNNPISSVYLRSNRLNEITNPNMYYKIGSQDYLKYKEQQKKYLNSNLETMLNNKRKKQEINVNPYNVVSSYSNLGKSTLQNNTILNPLPNYNYNKYLGNINDINNQYKIKRSASCNML